MKQLHRPLFYWLNVSMLLSMLLFPFNLSVRAAIGETLPSGVTLPTQPSAVMPPPTSSAGAAPEVGVAPAPNCALLDNPTARGMMSGALETALLHACGREAQAETGLSQEGPAEAQPETGPSTGATARVSPTPYSLLPNPYSPLSTPYLPSALGDDVLVNDPTGEATSMTQSGAVIARNENNGVLCAAYNDSYHGNVEVTGWTGFSSSGDGGATWSDHGSLNAPSSYGYPSLVWRRADGRFYLATLYLNGLGLWDLGTMCNWPNWVGMIHTGTMDDKEMLAVDNNPASPYYGRLYAVWTDFTDGHIYATRSGDGGQIWSPPVDVSGHNQVNGAWPAVDPVTGYVYVAWTHWDTYPDGPIDVEMARSTDGGATWNPLTNPMSDQINPRDATATANCGRPALNGDIRYFPYPQLAVDHSSNLHVVYSYDPDSYNTGDVVNIYYRRSTNGGVTWGNEIRVNDGYAADQFSPALAVAENGEIAVFWYDRRLDTTNNLLYDRYMAISRDGGLTFEANKRISDASSPVVPAGPGMATCYHGDYDGATAGGGAFYTVWGDDRRGDADVWSDSEPYFWGHLFGTVYDANTMRGVAEARVETVHAFTDIPFSAETATTGDYELSVPGDESYSVTAQAYGYRPNSALGYVDEEGARVDIPLQPADFWDVYGRVTDANTGYPVYARVAVTGDPLDPPAPDNTAWTAPHTGDYALHLAATIDYTLTVEAEGYISQTYHLGELTAHLFDINIALQPDLTACTAPGYRMTPPCQVAAGAVLTPPSIAAQGCPCAEQTHALVFANHTGLSGEVLLFYTTTAGVSVELPPSLGVVPETAVQPFDAVLKIDRGVAPGNVVTAAITAYLASNPAISATAVITKQAISATDWATRTNSPRVSMDGAVIAYGGKLYNVGGYGSGGAVDIYDPATDSWTTGTPEPAPNIRYPVDACFGYAAPNDPVILLLPDTTGAASGVWHRYHIASDTWDTPALPAPLPANGIWAPDIVVDYRANRCYITGGATMPGGGNLTTLYRYDPAANTATPLGNFTHIPAGFDFHAGWYAPWIGASGGICVGGGVDSASNVYADTQCYDIAAATFNPPNADLGPLPEPWWGMADAEKLHAGDRQLWLANGVAASWQLLQRSAYFSREAGRFLYGPAPAYALYRLEGDTVNGNMHVVDGSVAGLSPGTSHEQLLQCPACDDGVSLAKSGPDWTYSGDVVSYTVVITRPNWITGTAQLVDALPTGVEFAGGLSASFGNAWYSDTARAVYWTAEAAVGVTTPGAPIETFTNTWATAAVGLAYNPETDYSRYVHEGSGPYFIHDIAYPVPHPVLHSFNLSDVNPGWSNWRSGVGYDYAAGHYFVTDYGGGGIHHDNIIEIDPTGRLINAWETTGASNDSYDSSAISSIVDIAVVPGAPNRYFATALFDGGTVYELDLLKRGLFVANSWGTVMTCTVPGLGDNAGIDYDAQNGVLYHSSWDDDTVVVTDLRCNTLLTFTCPNGSSGFNSGVTFIEGQWPPEIWVTDYFSSLTTRCEAVGRAPQPEVVTVTFDVRVTAPPSTTVVNEAALDYRGSLANTAPAADVRYVAGTWSDNAVHLLDADLNDLGSFPAGAAIPNGMATDGETIWSGHFSPQSVVAHDFAGNELYRWSGSLSHLQGMELVNGTLAIYQSGNIEFHDPRTGTLIRTIPGRSGIEGLAFDGTLLWQLDGTQIYGTNPLDGSVVVTITNAASGCSFGGTGMAADASGILTLACTDGRWFRVSSADGSVIASGDNDLTMYGLAYVPPLRKVATQAFHVAPRPTITWTKEVYINGNYVGRYDEGPFTFVPGDDVQIVDRLDYVGREPLFVQLIEIWSGAPVTLTDEYHTRGVLTSNSHWYVTLRPGESERLVKTFHIAEAVPVTLYEQLSPDGMPVEERTAVFQPPQFIKDGPATAANSQIITYTLTLTTSDPLFGALRMTDTLPAGVEYVGGLNASYGYAWYSGGTRTVYWSNHPAAALTRRPTVVGAGLAPAHNAPAQEDGATTRVAPTAASDVGAGLAPAQEATADGATAKVAPTPYSLLPTPSSPLATWFAAAPIPTGRVRYARAQCPGEPNRFYVISGVPTSAAQNAWRYDADTDVWTTLARFPAPVEGPSAVCYRGHIYVAGGGGTTQFYIYDIARDTWTAGPPLPRNVWGAAFGAWDGRLFLAGGDNDFSLGGASTEVDIYDIATGVWDTHGAPVPVAASAPGWVQVNEYLYVVGGWSNDIAHNITATLRYNMAYDYWETGPTFSSARADFALAATDRYLYAIGGDADGGLVFDTTPLVERLDYTNWYGDAWTDISDPLPAALTAYSGGFCTTARSGGEVWSVGGLTAGFVFTSTNQYRPAEPCVTIPPTVTITFRARVTASPGERVTNTATLNFRGYLITATTALDVPLPEWEKQVNGQAWTPGLAVTVQTGDVVTVTDVISTASAFTLREGWDTARLRLLDYQTTPPVGAVTPYPWVEAPNAPFAYMRFDAEYSESTGHVYFLGGRTGTPTDGSIWEFDPATGVYTDTGVDMPVPVSNYNIARLIDSGGNEVLVTFGGRMSTGVSTNTVQGFYPASGATVVFAADPYPLVTSPGGVAVVNNVAYVFGGYDGSTVIPDTYIFDITAPAGSRWTAGPPLSQARSYIGAAVVDGVIYAVGGDRLDGTFLSPVTIVERLDTSAPTAWDDAGVADLPVACDEMQAFGFDSTSPYRLAGSVVVAGCGQWPDEYAESLRYNVASNTWDVTFPNLNQARRNHAGAFIPAGAGTGRPGLWVWGGRQGYDTNVLSTPEYYDLDAGALRWDVPAGLTQPVTFTKFFHVEPCTWTTTLLQESLNIGAWSEARDVTIEKLPPHLRLESLYEPEVWPNHPATFTLEYANVGGYENGVLLRNVFPPQAIFLSSTPPPKTVGAGGLSAEWELGDLPQGATGRITVTVAVTASLLPSATVSIWDGMFDHAGQLGAEAWTLFRVRPPEPAIWEKRVWVNGVLTNTDPIPVFPGDAVQIVDRIRITYTVPVSFTLAETWSASLLMTALAADVGPATWTPAGPAVVQGLHVAPNTWYAITKTFTVAEGTWILDLVTETLTVEHRAPVERVVRFRHASVCWPAAIVGLVSNSPVVRGTALHFTATVDGDAPITYAWNFGGAGVGAGLDGPTPVFTYTEAGTYTVTLNVANACGADHRETVVTVLKPEYTLNLVVAGPGSVTPPPGVHTYLEGATVIVTATANPGARFVGWSGDLTGSTNPATVMMNRNKTITATFEWIPPTYYTLTVATAGTGSGVVTPGVGAHSYLSGTTVVLTATANAGSVFAGWSGDASGTNPTTTVVMNAHKTVTAVFNLEGMCVPVTGVSLTRLTTGDIYTDTAINFRADIMPTTAVPYTYTLDFGEGASAPVSTLNNPLLFSHTFATTGTKTVTFTAWNCALTTPLSDAETFTVTPKTAPKRPIYLPLVMRNF